MARCKKSARFGPVTWWTDAYHHLRTSDPFCDLLKLLLDYSSIAREHPEDLAAHYELVFPALKLHMGKIDAQHAPDDLIQLLNPLHEILQHLGRHAKVTWSSLVYHELNPNEVIDPTSPNVCSRLRTLYPQIRELPVDWDFPDISDPSSLRICRSSVAPKRLLTSDISNFQAAEVTSESSAAISISTSASKASTRSKRGVRDSVDEGNIVRTSRVRKPSARKREAEQLQDQQKRRRGQRTPSL
ncbi:hypothetical protein B0H14DRAFT_3440275 [Mycena olivaceomarginata]|nr:hypothetical protein B0H14DRAFT_3440275 [Mycena olivaceomarginata]